MQAVWVFGSFARGALDPGDIDLDVEYQTDERFPLYRAGSDPVAPLRRELRGNRRGIQFQFDRHRELFKRGFDPLAKERLAERETLIER